MTTILFAGTEDIDFTKTGTVGVTTGATAIRTTYVRAGITVASGAATDPPTNFATCPVFANTTSFWVHGQFTLPTLTTTSNSQMLRVLDSGGVCRLIVRGTGTSAQVKISTRNAAGTITDLVTGSSGSYSVDTTAGFDLFINYAVAGTVTLYIGGVQVATFAGDVTTNSATTLAQVQFSGPNTSNACQWSECIVSDSDTRSMAYVSLAPVAAGNTQGWTPSTVGNINETTLSDASLVSTSSNNILSQWTTPTTLPSGSWTVRAVTQSARVQVAVTGPQHFDWTVRTIDGTDNLAGASLAPTTSFGNFSKIWNTNPKTATDWATSDIASGFNLGIKSLA